jgi:hypothetical protein
MSLSIIELLERVGVERVSVQNLLLSLASVRTRKGGQVEVSFFTGTDNLSCNEAAGLDPVRNVGLILWLPVADVKRAKQEHEAAHHTAGGAPAAGAEERP